MRQIYAGKICCECHNFLPERTDGRSGERRCQRCVEKYLHTVFLRYDFDEGWNVWFLEADAVTALPWRGRFTDTAKLYEIVRRSYQPTEAERDLENGLCSLKRGSVKLRLNADQYYRLKWPKARARGTIAQAAHGQER